MKNMQARNIKNFLFIPRFKNILIWSAFSNATMLSENLIPQIKHSNTPSRHSTKYICCLWILFTWPFAENPFARNWNSNRIPQSS